MKKRKKILIAPLNWGLGHAARCIPIIRELLQQDADVVIAADERPLALLQKEFPSLQCYRFEGHTIQYPANENLLQKIVEQVPHIAAGYFREQKVLNKCIDELKIDAVISDGRYGAFSRKVPSVFITHQLNILLHSAFRWSEYLLYTVNKAFIKNFNECWIPDYDGENNLSGNLAHQFPFPQNAFYVGPLSRFKKISNVEKKYDVLAVLSGPEPQRTLLEKILIQQLQPTLLRSLIVRGTPEQTESQTITEYLSLVPSMSADELNKTILASEHIIARSGYSTVMDIAALEKKAMFIPTPGQTEQEYLAVRFKKKKIFYSVSQNEFDLTHALDETKKYSGTIIVPDSKNILQQRIANLLKHL